MQKATAEIIAVRNRKVRVSVDAGTVCERCASGRGCGAGLFGASSGPRQLTVDVPDGLVLARGERVVLTLLPRHLLRAAMLVYGLPLAAMLLVPLGLQLYAGPLPDAALAVCSFGGVATAVLLARRYLQREACLGQFMPAIESQSGRDARSD